MSDWRPLTCAKCGSYLMETNAEDGVVRVTCSSGRCRKRREEREAETFELGEPSRTPMRTYKCRWCGSDQFASSASHGSARCNCRTRSCGRRLFFTLTPASRLPELARANT